MIGEYSYKCYGPHSSYMQLNVAKELHLLMLKYCSHNTFLFNICLFFVCDFVVLRSSCVFESCDTWVLVAWFVSNWVLNWYINLNKRKLLSINWRVNFGNLWFKKISNPKMILVYDDRYMMILGYVLLNVL